MATAGLQRSKNLGGAAVSLFMVVDEADCIKHWGGGFRKHYASLETLRWFVPQGVLVLATFATMPPTALDFIVRRRDQPLWTSIYFKDKLVLPRAHAITSERCSPPSQVCAVDILYANHGPQAKEVMERFRSGEVLVLCMGQKRRLADDKQDTLKVCSNKSP